MATVLSELRVKLTVLLLLFVSCSADLQREGFSSGGRQLLQSSVQSCPYDFSKVDFSNVTSTCKGPNYPASSCCPAFTALACQYTPQINDFNSLCPIYFLSYLNVAGDYGDGIFVGNGRCNKGNNLC